MQILQAFSPYNIFLAALFLFLGVILRIYYVSNKEKKKLQELNNKVKVYNKSIDAYEEGVLILSKNNDILFVNQEFGDYFKIDEKQITKKFLQSLTVTSIATPSREIGFLDAVDRRKHIYDVQISDMPEPIPIKISSNLFRGSEEDDTYWRVIVMHDMSEHYRLQKQMQRTQSYNDLLTDLPVQGRLMSDLMDANLNSNINGTSIILSFFGIRHFAALRSVLGYKKTNKMIQQTADLLKKNLHQNEKLYYRGRGDFATIIADSDNVDGDIKFIKDRIAKIQSDLAEKDVDVDFSQAIMHIARDRRSPDAIIDHCHTNQLESERSGETIVEEYNIELDEHSNFTIPNRSSNKHVFIKSDFTNAIQRKEFFSFYQPIFDLKTDKLIGAEYLMRWNHPKYGLMNASEFLDKAVSLNVLPEITDYLLENVLSHKASWDNLGIKDFNLSINFAMPELRITNFAEKLEKKIREHAIDAESITIDLSEKLLSEDINMMLEEVGVLKGIGVRIAMDSFGEGFTHLRLLEELPFDTIKIDQSLIRGIEISQDKKKLVSAIIALGKRLGVTIGATYIDSESIRNTLKVMGCDYGQGYYYSKALPFFEMLNFIQNYRKDDIDRALESSSRFTNI
jgi:EAL domain-containing protein (putative c-di-GMP-specific phosphodiesterase class I)/GGDEF domain-containing protein